MSQTSLPNIDWGLEVDRNLKQVAKRIRQIYACLEHLSSPKQPGCRDIPEEAAIEMQHALSHLALASDTESVEQKARRWHQALAHLNRAIIDFLKLFILEAFPQKKSSIEFMQGWLKTRQKEYWEHASGTQSPCLSSTTEGELFTIEEYEKLLNISLSKSSLDFTNDDLKGDNWKIYSKELDNWMNSDLMYGSLMAQKDVGNLEQLLDTLWSLDATTLAKYNLKTQIETLKIASNWGKTHDKKNNIWSEIHSTLSTTSDWTREDILPLYRKVLNYFGVSPWQAIRT